jgi:hypothetical protein
MNHRFTRFFRWLATLGTAWALAAPDDADACGMFVPRSLEETIPAIQQEQVLIVYDSEKKQQHFVREVSFEAGDGEFGFIVPTPKKPEVAAAKSPFKALREAYPFEKQPRAVAGGPPGSKGARGEGAGGAAPVQVLSVQRVGKFTAFVLAATDAKALEKWLADNRFQVPAASKAWLDHYVALGFFYVAFRYDAPKKEGERGLTSETVRISFSTPHPYYPYLEPAGARAASTRLLSIWFASDQPMLPVAARTRLGQTQHWRPWRAGDRYEPAAKELGPKLGALAKLLPAKKDKLVLQTFRDLKSSREGWGDVLMVPQTAQSLDAAAIEERRWLFPVLDPALVAKGGQP